MSSQLHPSNHFFKHMSYIYQWVCFQNRSHPNGTLSICNMGHYLKNITYNKAHSICLNLAKGALSRPPTRKRKEWKLGFPRTSDD